MNKNNWLKIIGKTIIIFWIAAPILFTGYKIISNQINGPDKDLPGGPDIKSGHYVCMFTVNRSYTENDYCSFNELIKTTTFQLVGMTILLPIAIFVTFKIFFPSLVLFCIIFYLVYFREKRNSNTVQQN